MGKNIVITDSTADLSKDLLERHNIEVLPLCIIMDDKSYFDGKDITPEEIIEWSDKNKTTPKTSAAGIEEAIEILRPHKEAGDSVIYIGISEDMSTTCNVVRLAADELEYKDVYVINSMNLSTGIGLQVLRAAEMLEKGENIEEVYEAINSARENVRASFVVDTLTFLARGGRCTAVTALLANTLKLKPRIEVKQGKMGVGTKYRGKMKKVLLEYVEDMKEDLLKADKTRVFVTYSVMDDREVVDTVVEYLKGLGYFDEILETRAGGVITSHCGPSTLGVLFYAE